METRTKEIVEMEVMELENKLMMVWQFAFDRAGATTEEQDNNVNVCITAIQVALTEARKELKGVA